MLAVVVDSPGSRARDTTALVRNLREVNALPVLQVAALLGAPGVVFVFSLFASTVAIAIVRGGVLERRGLDVPSQALGNSGCRDYICIWHSDDKLFAAIATS